MQKPHYKIWVEIEYIDEEQDLYEDASEPESLPVIFEDRESAELFRGQVLKLVNKMMQWSSMEEPK